jgi:hypothetical protein
MIEIVQLILSIVTGIYSGIIVAKYSEFRSLREESSRILQKGLPAKECDFELSLISSSLKQLGHIESAEQLSEIANDYAKLAKPKEIIVEDGSVRLPTTKETIKMTDENNQLRLRVSNLKPAWLYIIFPIL